MKKSQSLEASMTGFQRLAEKYNVGIEFHPGGEIQLVDPQFDLIYVIPNADLPKVRRVLAAILTNREYAK